MKTTILLSAALLGSLSLASVALAQDTSGQQNAQSASTSSTSTSGYGGVSGSSSASGGPRSAWANCGHLPQCNADSGH